MDEAVRTYDEMEHKLQDAKSIDTNLRSELIAAKKELEELRLKDLESKKKVEDVQKREEKLMSKVREDFVV